MFLHIFALFWCVESQTLPPLKEPLPPAALLFAPRFAGTKFTIDKPSNASWRSIEFDDSAWSDAILPFGYEDDTDRFDHLFNTTYFYRGALVTVFHRLVFLLDQVELDFVSEHGMRISVASDDQMSLRVNDGVAFRSSEQRHDFFYWNDEVIVGGQASSSAGSYVVLSNNLVLGENVIAIELENVGTTSSDMFLDVQVSANDRLFGWADTWSYTPSLDTIANASFFSVDGLPSGIEVASSRAPLGRTAASEDVLDPPHVLVSSNSLAFRNQFGVLPTQLAFFEEFVLHIFYLARIEVLFNGKLLQELNASSANGEISTAAIRIDNSSFNAGDNVIGARVFGANNRIYFAAELVGLSSKLNQLANRMPIMERTLPMAVVTRTTAAPTPAPPTAAPTNPPTNAPTEAPTEAPTTMISFVFTNPSSVSTSFIDQTTQKLQNSDSEMEMTSVGLIVGASIGGVFCCILLLLALAFALAKRKSETASPEPAQISAGAAGDVQMRSARWDASSNYSSLSVAPSSDQYSLPRNFSAPSPEQYTLPRNFASAGAAADDYTFVPTTLSPNPSAESVKSANSSNGNVYSVLPSSPMHLVTK